MNGFVLLHRKMVDWEWYTDINVKALFIHLILMANHSDQNWRGQVVKRGELVTSIGNLAAQNGMTVMQVRTALKKLQKTGDVTIKTTSKNTVIMVVNYDFYQAEQQTNNTQNNNQVTIEQQTNNNQITTNNNDNNVNNDNNDNKRESKREKTTRFLKPTLDDVIDYCNERGNGINAQKFIDYYEANGWMVGRNKMKDWKAAIRNWESREKQDRQRKELFPF